jgi:hypothetical protein
MRECASSCLAERAYWHRQLIRLVDNAWNGAGALTTEDNRFVIRREPAGTGYHATMVLGTAVDLVTLSNELREIGTQGSGGVDHLVAA